jgi:hypothetical protein
MQRNGKGFRSVTGFSSQIEKNNWRLGRVSTYFDLKKREWVGQGR